ncbi:unnamed protein product [Rotaria sordida]|uniref:Nuclear receptor domain-containing protein n=1 Tax=Rotaria sordida TaxID=392033 RepID=A0A815JZ00_9BILA|nr:unnamed protein product [Rotaria sordida]
MSTIFDHQPNQTSWPSRECIICNSKAIGINFGALTCAPCKAFFRRNARRKEILESPCQHRNIDLSIVNYMNDSYKIDCYLQIRRCSSCRLRRCFNMGMKEELIRTDEENIRHKQLVDMNRRKREFLKQKQQNKQLSISQCIVNNDVLLHESDWCHLTNIVSAYETHCLKTYIQQRSTMYSNETKSCQHQHLPTKYCTALPMTLTISLCSFLQSLPAFHSLSHINRMFLCKNNLRLLLFPNMFELRQSCFFEPWQISLEKATWELICGPQLFEEFNRTAKLVERSLITDPIIIRLWLVVLFFSSSLFCLYDNYLLLKIPKKKTAIIDIQNIYATLLWKYLLYRHGYFGAVQIYSNLIHTYLQMQRIGFEIGVQVRTRNELLITYETLNQILTFDIRNN